MSAPEERLQVDLDRYLAIAAAAGCRLAVRPIFEAGIDVISMEITDDVVVRYRFVMLGPGETPPAGAGWTIYEQTANGWRGRSAL